MDYCGSVPSVGPHLVTGWFINAPRTSFLSISPSNSRFPTFPFLAPRRFSTVPEVTKILTPLTFTLTPTTRSLQDIQADHDSSRSNTRTCFRLVHIFSLCYSPYSNSNFTSLRASIEPSIIKLHLSLSLVATEQTGPSRELCCHAFYTL